MTRITKEELLEKIFNDDYEHLKGKKLRMTRVRVPGKEVCLAHIINTSQTPVYQNLGLHIGVHEGEDHTGESIGLIRFTPWEAVVVAADVAIWIASAVPSFEPAACHRYRPRWKKSFDFFMKIWDFAPVRSIKTKRTGDMTI